MSWQLVYLPEALDDLKKLDGSQQKLVRKSILKVATNPQPSSEGGYGKPLRNTPSSNLTGMLKIKLRNSGLRIVYRIVRMDEKMLIIIIGTRADNEVYKEAVRRITKNKL